MLQTTNTLYLIVGPSGTGKTSILDALVAQGVLGKATSHSTRAMRPGEVQGDPYWFVSLSEFEGLQLEDQFIERVLYNNQHYGFTRGEVEYALRLGDVGMIVEAHGAKQFIRLFPNNTKTIFLYPPPREELRRRMLERNDTPEAVEERLALVSTEMDRSYHLANWSVDSSRPLAIVVAQIASIIKNKVG